MGHTEHTPGACLLSKSGEVIYCGGVSIATTYGHSNSLNNAARIVTCWNEYDDLRNKVAELALKATGYEIKSEKLQKENDQLKADIGILMAQISAEVTYSSLLKDENEALKQKVQQYEQYIEYCDGQIIEGRRAIHFVEWREGNNLPHL